MGEAGAVGAVGRGALAEHHGPDAAQRRADRLGGERTDHVGTDDPGPDAVGAQPVGHVLRGLRGRVHQEDRDLGVVHAVEVDGVVAAAAQRLVLGEHLGECAQRGVHRPLELVLVVDQVGIVHVRPDRHRVPRVERRYHLRHRAEPALHGGVVGEGADAALLVAGEEAVEGHDRGQPHVGALGDPQRDEVHVVDGLRVARHEDQPARVQGVVDIGVVTTDVERPAHGARRDIEQHRIARSRLDGQLLQRIQQPLRARRVEDAAAAGGGAVADACGAVLAVGRHHHDLVLAGRLHLVEELGDLGRGRDRVIAHQMEVHLLSGQRGHLVARAEPGNLRCAANHRRRRCDRHQTAPLSSSSQPKSGTRFSSAHPSSSRISVSEPVGHASMHFRQPLQ